MQSEEWIEWDERHRRQSCEGSSERNALTTIPPLRYAHRYDYQIFYPHFFNRLWQPLRCARSIPQPERVARCIALTG